MQEKRYFGTDGIRGVYGEDLTDGLALLVGNSLGIAADGGTVVVGRDTRPSGEALSRALAEGVLAAGGNVMFLGTVTTPCVAYLTRKTGASAGVMISASHNPPRYNGIKIFGADGAKASHAKELAVEKHVFDGRLSYSAVRGEVISSNSATEDYVSELCRRTGSLAGMKIVLDCANGAAEHLAPAVFGRLGAQVVAIGCAENGALINENCGALHPEHAAEEVRRTGADLGLSFDGDADRVIAVDEKGGTVDGDKILYVLARAAKAAGELPFGAVVGTLHTNIGAEAALRRIDIDLVRTDIGDHNVTRCMRESGILLGAEQSGHIVIGDFLPTGDGIFAGAMLARVLRDSGMALSALADFPLFPQRNADIATSQKNRIARDKKLAAFVSSVEDMLGDSGRVMIRPSGTENKLRVMAECRDPFLADFAARSIELFIRTGFDLF